ncbi:MAG: DUF5723 family protein [Melioribacteraceae bacterium]
MKNIFSLIILAISLLEIYGQGIGSYGITDAKSIGIAKAFSSSFGLYAVGKNPANLFQDSSSISEMNLSIPIPHLSFSAGTNFLSISDYNYYFGTKVTGTNNELNGRKLTEDDKQNLKNIFQNGSSIYSDISIQSIGIKIQPSKKIGAFGFSVIDRISFSLTIPKSLITLFLDGNIPGQIYNFSDAKFNAWWLRKTSVTYSNKINFLKGLYIGASVNFVSGYFYSKVERLNTEFKTVEGNALSGKSDYLIYLAASEDFNIRYNFDKRPKKNFTFSFFPKPAGYGIGIDFGLTSRVSQKFTFTLSFTDIGSINWYNNVAELSSKNSFYIDDLTDKNQIDSLKAVLSGNGKYINSLKLKMATAMHLGLAWTNKTYNYYSDNKLLILIEYHQGFNNEFGNSKSPRIVLGIEYTPKTIVSIRSGLSIGDIEKIKWSFGCGLNFGFLEINMGTLDILNIFQRDKAKNFSIAFGSIIRFL